MGPFESFSSALFDGYTAALAKTLPPPPRVQRLWRDPTKLAWMGFVHEQESFHLWCSFGLLKEADEFTRDNLGAKGADYLASERVERAAKAYRKLPGPMDLSVPYDEDEDDDAFELDDETVDEFRKVLAMTALGLCALAVGKDKALTPMPRARNFSIVLSDDTESPTWNAGVPSVSERSKEIRKFLLESYCETGAARDLIGDVLAMKKRGDFLPALAALPSAKRYRLRRG